MKPLYLYLEELAAPANTVGMGNPMPPTDGQVGSEPLVTAKSKKEKKRFKKTSFNDYHNTNPLSSLCKYKQQL